jgi:hypothetical protein
MPNESRKPNSESPFSMPPGSKEANALAGAMIKTMSPITMRDQQRKRAIKGGFRNSEFGFLSDFGLRISGLARFCPH